MSFEPKKCIVCGKEFVPKSWNSKICSEECRREKNRENCRKWREANPEKHREYNRKWYEANPEKQREYNRKWREANPEKNREKCRKWREANPEKQRKYYRKWREANPEYRKNRYEQTYVELSQIANISIDDLKAFVPPMFIERELVCWDSGSYFLDFICVVQKRAGGKCELTGKKSSNLEVHHLDGYNWCIEGRVDPDNAVCIDKAVHKAFHDRYGRGDNTREQWEEFKANYQKETESLDKWL